MLLDLVGPASRRSGLSQDRRDAGPGFHRTGGTPVPPTPAGFLQSKPDLFFSSLFLLGEGPKEEAVLREEGVVGRPEFGKRTREVRSRAMPRRQGRPRVLEGAGGDILS